MTEDQKPFIFIEFDEMGSHDYKVSFNNITSSQLFLMSGVLQFQAGESYLKELLEIQKAQQTKGILKP